MEWIYFSPHLDDGVLSCGGIIWEQIRAGEHVQIWTICAGDPPPGEFTPFAESLHLRWGTGHASSAVRREEDLAACQVLGAKPFHFDIPDCIYRRLPDGSPLINGEEDLWKPVHPGEMGLVEHLVKEFASRLPASANLVVPLGIGGHTDHRLVRAALEKNGGTLFYYAEYPYAAESEVDLQTWLAPDWQEISQEISAAALNAWQDAVAEHTSQISTFWGGLDEMRASILTYSQAGGGSKIWKAVV